MGIAMSMLFMGYIVVLVSSSMKRYTSDRAKAVYFTILPSAWVLHLAYGTFVMATAPSYGQIMGAIYFICGILWYFVWKRDKDKDDRWKKWRKKAAEKVSVLNGRLVTVSAR